MNQDSRKKQGRGLLIAGRILLALAILALIATLALFIHNTVQNAQDQIFDAIPEFFHETYGAVTACVAFLLCVFSYLVLLVFYRMKGSATGEGRKEFITARVLVAIVGIIVIVSGFAKMMYK